MKLKKLSIITLFCDKDYIYIPRLLKDLDSKICCNFELILVDNREKFKDVTIPEISRFFGNHKGRLISKGENLCQLAAKKLALNYVSGDYVWFVDGDDNLNDMVPDFILNNCSADIVVFNYINYFEKSDRFDVYQKFWKSEKFHPKQFRNQGFLRRSYVTCWNKWFKTNLIKDIFKNVDMDIRVSANEDVWIYLSMLNRAKKVQSIPRFFYVYNTERGVSTNTHISSFDSFIKIRQGWEQSLNLLKTEFPQNTKLFNFQDKLKSDFSYFFSRICESEKSIQDQEILELITMFGKDFIKESLLDGTVLTLSESSTDDIELLKEKLRGKLLELI